MPGVQRVSYDRFTTNVGGDAEDVFVDSELVYEPAEVVVPHVRLPSSSDDEETFIVRNTFLELCKLAESGALVDAARFVSAPAVFSGGKECILDSTTVMIRNIPTRTSMLTLREVCFPNQTHIPVDFLYLPIDFKTGKNLGYSFLNFKQPVDAAEFIYKFNGKKYLFGATSEKRLSIDYSNRQGFLNNVRVFVETKLIDTWPPEYRPQILVGDSLVPIDTSILAQILAT